MLHWYKNCGINVDKTSYKFSKWIFIFLDSNFFNFSNNIFLYFVKNNSWGSNSSEESSSDFVSPPIFFVYSIILVFSKFVFKSITFLNLIFSFKTLVIHVSYWSVLIDDVNLCFKHSFSKENSHYGFLEPCLTFNIQCTLTVAIGHGFPKDGKEKSVS